MQDSYRLILEKGSNLMQTGAFVQSRPLPAEPMERMVQSATYGRQMLQSASAQSNPDLTTPAAGGADKEAPASKRQVRRCRGRNTRVTNHVLVLPPQRGDEHAQEAQTCLGCHATSTPEWRRGPMGEDIVFNLVCEHVD